LKKWFECTVMQVQRCGRRKQDAMGHGGSPALLTLLMPVEANPATRRDLVMDGTLEWNGERKLTLLWCKCTIILTYITLRIEIV